MRINFTKKGLTEIDIDLVTEALEKTPENFALLLSGNRFNDEETLRVLWRAINTHGVKVLDLSDNAIGPAGARAIAQGLAENKGLVRLNLARNRLGKEGALMLAKVIPSHPTIAVLNLENNQLTDLGAAEIIKSIIGHRSMVSLYLHSNQVGDQSTLAMKDPFLKKQELVKQLKKIPLQCIELQKEGGVSDSVHGAVNELMYNFCDLPMEVTISGKNAELTENIRRVMDWEYSLISNTIEFFEATVTSEEKWDGLSVIRRFKFEVSGWRDILTQEAKCFLELRRTENHDMEFKEARCVIIQLSKRLLESQLQFLKSRKTAVIGLDFLQKYAHTITIQFSKLKDCADQAADIHLQKKLDYSTKLLLFGILSSGRQGNGQTSQVCDFKSSSS